MEELHAAILAYLREQRAPARRPVPPAGSRVLIYARTVFGRDGEPTLDAQEARCRAHARAHGYVVVATLHEAGEGRGPLRPRLAVLRALLRRGGIAAVLVTALDRLAHDPADAATLRAEWASLGVALVVVGERPGA